MTADPPRVRVACFATQGSGSGDEARVSRLLTAMDPEIWSFNRRRKATSFLRLVQKLTSRPDLVVMEGTGISGGSAVLLGHHLMGVPFVVSSGDAVAPFWASRHPALGLVGVLYEKRLCKASAGFIGWTPYLVGRALTYGAPRAMTAANWSPAPGPAAGDRDRIRRELGVAADAVVFGLVGSLQWTPRRNYCYGLDLVRAVRKTTNHKVVVVVVGDGSGRPTLEREAGDLLGKRVFLPGQVPRDDVASILSAFDVAALPQSTDQVGAFRYTTKLSEYLAAGLPIVTSRIPAAYDVAEGWCWRLPGKGPWGDDYVDAQRELMDRLGPAEISAARRRVPNHLHLFDVDAQATRVEAFLKEILTELR